MHSIGVTIEKVAVWDLGFAARLQGNGELSSSVSKEVLQNYPVVPEDRIRNSGFI